MEKESNIPIEINLRDLADLLTRREVTKGSIKIKVDPMFFNGLGMGEEMIIVQKRLEYLLMGERIQ